MSATTASPVNVPVEPLPRDIDVTVTISRPQTELQSDLSLLCFVTPDVAFPPDNDRVRVYSTSEALIKDTGWQPADTGYWAAKAFFDQAVRPPRLAVGRVFTEAVPAQVMAAAITDFDSLRAVADGSFAVDFTDADGVTTRLEANGVDFTAVTTLQSVAAAVNAALAASGHAPVMAATLDYGGRLVLSDLLGNAAMSYPGAASSGVDVSALLNLTQEAGARKWDAYAPAGLVGEIRLVAAAARVGGYPAYAWALDKRYRDTAEQRAVSDWAESQGWKAWALQCTNKPTAHDSGDATNICFYAHNLAYKATSTQFSANPQYYPEIAYATSVLAVNYSLRDSVVTACFKDASGIPPENVTETQLAVLASRNCNVFVRVGNTARTHRYGTQAASTWWTDSYAGACNFREALQVNVANCLYRNKKVPYTTRGQAMVVSAIAKACNDYVYNGYLADRDVLDESNENGYSTMKAYLIEPTPIYRATETQRASRVLPPINVTTYEAGAIHHVDLYVDLVN